MVSIPEMSLDHWFAGSSGGAANGGHIYRMNTVNAWWQDDTNMYTTVGGDANNYTATANMGGVDDDLPGEYKRNYYTALDVSAASTEQIRAIDADRTITAAYTKTLPDSNRRFVRFPGAGKHRVKQTNILASTVAGQ